MKRNEMTVLLIGVVILLAIAIGLMFWNRKDDTVPTDTGTSTIEGTTTPSGGTSGTTGATAPPPAIVVLGKTHSEYQAAVDAYAYRVEFSGCQGVVSPGGGQLFAKQGSLVMFDNRDATSHTFAVNSKTFQIAGHDFTVIRLQETGKQIVTCDGGGAAELYVQP